MLIIHVALLREERLQMNTKKQGRRSAQTAEMTKKNILCVAGELFCEFGYERVSLRQISEQAGVSHSLIRYHFGCKDKIWYAVSDALHEFITQYIQQLVLQLANDKPSNIQLYQFSMRMQALLLLYPKPIQFTADTVRKEGKFSDYFLDKHGQVEKALQELHEQYNQDNPHNKIELWELKWQMIMSAHAAASLQPLLNTVWKEQATSPDAILHKHWQLFNKQMVALFNIPTKEILHPISLKELILASQINENGEISMAGY